METEKDYLDLQRRTARAVREWHADDLSSDAVAHMAELLPELWTVNVTYPVKDTFGIGAATDETLDRLGEQAGADRKGSGSGFGERDVQFDVAGEDAAEALANRIEAAVPGATVSVRLNEAF